MLLIRRIKRKRKPRGRRVAKWLVASPVFPVKDSFLRDEGSKLLEWSSLHTRMSNV